MLIELVQLNDNNTEAVRLSVMALERFKSDLSFLNDHIGLLLKLGYFDEARRYLEQMVSDGKASIDNRLDLVELDFPHHSDRAGLIFQRLLDKDPANIRALVGALSARSFQTFGPPKIGFLLSAHWHWTIQKSVTQALDALQTSCHITTRLWALKRMQPAIVVISDAAPRIVKWLRTHLPQAKIVNTRHGLAIGGKNYGLYAAAATDYLCVSSDSVKQDLCQAALLNEERVWVTGYSQMDSLFGASTPGPGAAAGKRVTFAPTCDLSLSALAVIGSNPVHWIRGTDRTIHLTIRPHPHLFRDLPVLMQQWSQLIKNEPNCVMDDKPLSDLSALLINTDLLISDVSSAALQFMALNKPIISVVDPDKARSSPKYAPEELEWKMHAATVVVQRKEQLHQAVKAALAGVQDPKIALERQRISDYLFGGMADGRAGERIAQRLVSLTANTTT